MFHNVARIFLDCVHISWLDNELNITNSDTVITGEYSSRYNFAAVIYWVYMSANNASAFDMLDLYEETRLVSRSWCYRPALQELLEPLYCLSSRNSVRAADNRI